MKIVMVIVCLAARIGFSYIPSHGFYKNHVDKNGYYATETMSSSESYSDSE